MQELSSELSVIGMVQLFQEVGAFCWIMSAKENYTVWGIYVMI